MHFTADALVGRRMLDNDGRYVGAVTAWYQYPRYLNAAFGVVVVRTGRLLRARHLVDLLDATLDGDVLTVAYPAALIGAAPHHTPLVGNTLSDQHAADVLAHYRASMAPA
jgi:hypothetical protein